MYRFFWHAFSGGRDFFLALSAAGQGRGPSVHYDACLDPGKASWRVLSSIQSRWAGSFGKGLSSASLSRVGAWKPHLLFLFFPNSPLRSHIFYPPDPLSLCTAESIFYFLYHPLSSSGCCCARCTWGVFASGKTHRARSIPPPVSLCRPTPLPVSLCSCWHRARPTPRASYCLAAWTTLFLGTFQGRIIPRHMYKTTLSSGLL